MKETIQRGNIVLGSLTYESEATALGRDVIAETAFPFPECDSVEQCESLEEGVRFLHAMYEAHCAANGVVPAPRLAEVARDEQEDYYARLQESEAAERAYHEAAIAAELAENPGTIGGIVILVVDYALEGAQPELQDDDSPF
jgi:hypothetical protein